MKKMKKPVGLLARMRSALGHIHLIDRCLILFMVVLLSQSAFSLTIRQGNAQQTETIDVIVRTSCAAIFGYFLSANFICRQKPGNRQEPEAESESAALHTEAAAAPKGRIGFALPGEEQSAVTRGNARAGESEPQGGPGASRLQVYTATGIGLFCLFVLLFLRNFSGPDSAWMDEPSIAATIGQFRDFVSGCVGFLIGTPTTGQEKE